MPIGHAGLRLIITHRMKQHPTASQAIQLEDQFSALPFPCSALNASPLLFRVHSVFFSDALAWHRYPEQMQFLISNSGRDSNSSVLETIVHCVAVAPTFSSTGPTHSCFDKLFRDGMRKRSQNKPRKNRGNWVLFWLENWLDENNYDDVADEGQSPRFPPPLPAVAHVLISCFSFRWRNISPPFSCDAFCLTRESKILKWYGKISIQGCFSRNRNVR